MKKRAKRREKKKLSRTRNRLLYALLGIVILFLLFNLGKPVSVDDNSFLGGLLKSMGLLGGGGVVSCGGSGDAPCATCVEKCGRSEFCIPSGKKICTKGGKCIDEGKKCPCATSADCNTCSEVCTGGKCTSTGNKLCPDGSCISEGVECKCTGGASCESFCDKCSGSPDYVCNLDATKFISCSGGCCPIKNSAGQAMQCCTNLASAPGACCKTTEGCSSVDVLGVTANVCVQNAASCVAPDYICSKGVGNICCNGTKYTGCEAQWRLLPTCTTTRGACVAPSSVCPASGVGGGSPISAVLCCDAGDVCVKETRVIMDFYACVANTCGAGEFICTGVGDKVEITKCCVTNVHRCGLSPSNMPTCVSV